MSHRSRSGPVREPQTLLLELHLFQPQPGLPADLRWGPGRRGRSLELLFASVLAHKRLPLDVDTVRAAFQQDATWSMTADLTDAVQSAAEGTVFLLAWALERWWTRPHRNH